MNFTPLFQQLGHRKCIQMTTRVVKKSAGQGPDHHKRYGLDDEPDGNAPGPGVFLHDYLNCGGVWAMAGKVGGQSV